MSAVQWPLRSVNSHVNVLIAAYSEDNFLASRLMYWSITNNPGVSQQQILMKVDDFAEMRRARLLFTFENEFDVEQRRNVLRPQGVESGENRHHAGFII